MPARNLRMQQHLADLKMLADLLGGIADRLPRGEGRAGIQDREALAIMDVALPRLTTTCNALFETLNEESAEPQRSPAASIRATDRKLSS